jgi:hypothetical protein
MYIFADHGINRNEYNRVASLVSEEMYNIIKNNIYDHFCFGHDIHLSRLIIFDMLNKNIITNKETLIVTKDRQFLYSSIFENVITFEEFIYSLQKDNIYLNIDNFIFLPRVVGDLLSYVKTTELLYYNYDVYNATYWNCEMEKKITTLNNIEIEKDLQEITKDDNFIIFVIRSFPGTGHIVDEKYKMYLEKLREMTVGKFKLIVFCQENIEIDKEIYDFKINKIKDLACLLLLDNCIYFIGEISGLMEFSYYHHGSNLTILEFHNNCHNKYNDALFKNDRFKNNLMEMWNEKYIHPINHKLCSDFNDVLYKMQLV